MLQHPLKLPTRKSDDPSSGSSVEGGTEVVAEGGGHECREERVGVRGGPAEDAGASGAIWKLHRGRGKLEVGKSLTSMKGIVMFIPA